MILLMISLMTPVRTPIPTGMECLTQSVAPEGEVSLHTLPLKNPLPMVQNISTPVVIR